MDEDQVTGSDGEMAGTPPACGIETVVEVEPAPELGEAETQMLLEGIAAAVAPIRIAAASEDGAAPEPTYALLDELDRLWARPLAA